MTKLTKKNNDKMFEVLKKAIDDKESVIVATESMTLVMGNPLDLCASLMQVIKTIRKQDVAGKICIEGLLRTLEEENEEDEPTEKEKEKAFGDILEMFLDALK